jgi:hypothetical protein
MQSTGAGVFGYCIRRKLNFGCGQYTMVFQAKMYAIESCASENIDKGYKIETSVSYETIM